MNRLFFLLVFAAIINSCDKTDENIIWQGSFGQGKALTVKNAGDSGFVSAGMMDGRQYLLFLDNDKNKVLEYKSDLSGALTGLWIGDGYFITTGTTGGKMFLSKIDMKGTVIWDSLITTSFRIDHTTLCKLNGDNFVAIGSADPDSAVIATSRLSFVWFTGTGSIVNRKDDLFSTYVSAKAAAADNSGNIYLGLARLGTMGNLKATVAMYHSLYKRIEWEKELYNNPSFGAASLGITLDESKNPVVSGRTGMQVSAGVETNAFVARYVKTGDLLTKTYLEYSNTGCSVVPDGTGKFYVLNSKCLIVNVIDADIAISGIIRTFSSCDPKTTDSFGYSFDLTSDGNLIIGGSKGSGYYLAIKSSSALSPV